MERIVRRSELRSGSSSPSSSSDLEIDHEDREVQRFDFMAPATSGNETTMDEDPQDEELDFRLFLAPTQTASSVLHVAAQKIRLHSPPVEARTHGFLKAERDRSYYFAQPPSNQEKDELTYAAVTGEQVLANSHSPWPGSHYPWKVLTLPPSCQVKDIEASAPELFRKLVGIEKSGKRTRPGKKFRIRLRTAKAAKVAHRSATKAAEEAKEVAEREKRTRRNREKKVKKKAKEKAKKGVGGEVVGDGVGAADDEP